MLRLRKFLVAFLLVSLLLVTSCASQPPSRYEGAQQESTKGPQRNQAVSKEATQGSEFNKFFPSASGGFERVYTQEKKGFAEAKLKKDGQDVAMLSISDTISNPSAAAKFKSSTKNINGYPSVLQGSTATAVLVADRYQVKVQSRDPGFTEADRETWLSKFNLGGLARLK